MLSCSLRMHDGTCATVCGVLRHPWGGEMIGWPRQTESGAVGRAWCRSMLGLRVDSASVSASLVVTAAGRQTNRYNALQCIAMHGSAACGRGEQRGGAAPVGRCSVRGEGRRQRASARTQHRSRRTPHRHQRTGAATDATRRWTRCVLGRPSVSMDRPCTCRKTSTTIHTQTHHQTLLNNYCMRL